MLPSLNPNRTGAVDFHAYTPSGEAVPLGQLFSEALDAKTTATDGARLIWHDVGTVTRTPHLHADKSKDGHKYEAGQRDARGEGVYKPVNKE